MKRTRRNHGATFKAQIAFAAIKGDKTVAELAEQFSVHPTQITDWKQQLLAWAADITYSSDATRPRLSLCDPGLGQSPGGSLIR